MAELLDFRCAMRANRISVTGNCGAYLVRINGAEAYQVIVEAGETRCECGGARCAHIVSLRACGFMDDSASLVQEAQAA